jgi:hypothetical protein
VAAEAALNDQGGVKRWLSRAGITVMVVLALLLGYSCFWPQDRSSYTALAARLTQDGVTYVANGPLYVVLQPDGGFLALDETPRVHADFLNGCVIRWDPDQAGGVMGTFHADERCGAAVFGRDGTPVAGGLPMLRHPVRLAGKSVVVDIRQCIPPEEGPAAMPRSCSVFRR